jgi:hypothetical protein
MKNSRGHSIFTAAFGLSLYLPNFKMYAADTLPPVSIQNVTASLNVNLFMRSRRLRTECVKNLEDCMNL